MIYEIFEDSFESQGKRYLSNARMCSLVMGSYFNHVHIANHGLLVTLKSLKRILMYRYVEADTTNEEDYNLYSYIRPRRPSTNQAQAQEIMRAKDWLTSALNASLDHHGTDWESNGLLKPHELKDRSI